MKKITFGSSYGNFDYRMTAVIGDEVNAATEQLCLQGLANICYRVAGSNVDKVLGAKVRKEVEYSEQDAERINNAVAGAIKKLEEKEGSGLRALQLDFAVTGQHVFGEVSGAPTKEAQGYWLEYGKSGKQAEVAARLGLEVGYTEEQAVRAIQAKLLEAKRAAAASAMAGMLG